MKSFQKATAALLASLMLVSSAGCGSNTTPASQAAPAGSSAPAANTDSAKTLRIYGWNTEFQSRFNTYFKDAGKLPEGINVEWVITPNENNAYQNKLDQDLKAQDSATDKIDIFLIEADYALKYVDSDYTLDVKGDIGLTDEDMKDQYEYTKDIATDSNKKLKAVSWQATPGLFAYRRSIAKAVLGTDDPVKVQAALSDWDKFNSVAKTASDKGYKMLSGYDDSYRTFANNITSPWVDSSDTIHIDPIMMKWVDQTKEFTDKNYNNKTSLWAPEWHADQGPAGKVFGFFYSTWGINFTLLGDSLAKPEKEGGKKEVGNGAYGDYAVCQGPANYYWGGSWICGAKGSDNVDLVRDVMKTLTCDPVTMKKITEDTEDFTNNQTAMGELAKSDYKSAFLGGQNHIALFAEASPKINMKNISKYDQGMTEEFQKAFKDYFDGNVSKDQALDNFYKAVTEKYPNLKRAS